MEVVGDPVSTSVSHPVIPAGTAGGGSTVGLNGSRVYGSFVQTHVLHTHGLGYVPDFFIIEGGNAVHPGYPIQFNASDGRARCVAAYATTTQIILREFGIQTSNALDAINVTYTLLILRAPPAASGNILMDFNPTTGVTTLGRGKFSSDRRYLQIVAGGTPYNIPLDRTVDLNNGAPRSAIAGTIRDIVPSNFRIGFGFEGRNDPRQFGPAGTYNGSYTGPPTIQVKAP